MLLAQRLNRIKPSPTLFLNTKAHELKSQGIDIINLAVGEPDFDTPAWIKQAAVETMNAGMTKYTAVDGTEKLKRAIVDKFKRENNLHYSLSEVMASTGGKQVIFNAFMATLNPGDEVIIPAPYWVSYPELVNFFDGTCKFIQCPDNQFFKITPEQLEASITPHTKWIILNSPSNPTGAVYKEDELCKIANILLAHPHINILTDDIYEHLIFDHVKFSNIIQVCSQLKERTLIVNGLSKSFAMTGWRLGYGAGSEKLIKAMTLLQSQSTSNACSITQGAAVEALNGPQEFLNEWRSSFEQRRDFLFQEINKIDGLRCIKPEGAFYLYINCEKNIGKKTPQGVTINHDEDFCIFLLEHANIAVVPGKAFGLSPYFRISYAVDMESLSKAIQNLKKAIESLS